MAITSDGYHTYRDGSLWEWHKSVLGGGIIVSIGGYRMTLPSEDLPIARLAAGAKDLLEAAKAASQHFSSMGLSADGYKVLSDLQAAILTAEEG
jgi:hypothetical protein